MRCRQMSTVTLIIRISWDFSPLDLRHFSRYESDLQVATVPVLVLVVLVVLVLVVMECLFSTDVISHRSPVGNSSPKGAEC